MAIEKIFFRQVMGHFTTGVTIVTTSSKGVLAGLTVNSFCSVSLEPPLVLICVDLHSSTLPMFRESGVFAVNMLTEEQEELSRCFATPNKDRFGAFCHAPNYTVATGAPVLTDVLAFVDVRIVAEYPGGDHAIFMGKVEAMGSDGKVQFLNAAAKERSTLTEWSDEDQDSSQEPRPDKWPLAYYQGQYRHLARD